MAHPSATAPASDRCWFDLRREVEHLIEGRSPNTQRRVRSLLGACDQSRYPGQPSRSDVHVDPRLPPPATTTTAAAASSSADEASASWPRPPRAPSQKQSGDPSLVSIERLSARTQLSTVAASGTLRFLSGGPLITLPDTSTSLVCVPRRDPRSAGSLTFAVGGYDGVLRIAERPQERGWDCHVLAAYGVASGAILSIASSVAPVDGSILALGTATGGVELVSLRFSDVDGTTAASAWRLNASSSSDHTAGQPPPSTTPDDALLDSVVVVPWSSSNRISGGGSATRRPSRTRDEDVTADGRRSGDQTATDDSEADFAVGSDVDADDDGVHANATLEPTDVEHRMVDSMILSGTDSRASFDSSSTDVGGGGGGAPLAPDTDQQLPPHVSAALAGVGRAPQIQRMARCCLPSSCPAAQPSATAAWRCAVTALTFHDARTAAGSVLAGTRDGRIFVVDVATGARVVAEVPLMPPGGGGAPNGTLTLPAVSQLLTLPQSNGFLASGSNGLICTYDARTKPRPVGLLCGGVPMSPATEGWQRRLSTARAALNELRGGAASVGSAVRSLHRWRSGDDWTQIMAASDDGTLRLFDLRKGTTAHGYVAAAPASHGGTKGANTAVWSVRATRKPLLAAVPLASSGGDVEGRYVALSFIEDTVKIVRVVPHVGGNDDAPVRNSASKQPPPHQRSSSGNSNNVSFNSDGGGGANGSASSSTTVGRYGSEHMVSIKGMHKSRHITCTTTGATPSGGCVVLRACVGGCVSVADIAL